MYRKQVRRRRAVLTILILGSFLLLTLTYEHSSSGVQRGVSTIFSPLETVADRALKPARDLVGWFGKTFDARGENNRLKAELVKARRQAAAGQEALSENEQLRDLVGLDRDPALAESAYEPLIARVVARSPTVWNAAVTVDVGSSDGVHLDDPVISGDGVVGRIASVEHSSSQVTLLTNHASAVSAKVVPAGVQGVVEPEIGNPDDLILNFIDSTKEVHQGEMVLTAGWRAQGLGPLFPPGLPIGEVTTASLVEQEASQLVHLRAYADLANLDLVQVLTGGSRR